jgi:hypothetical protein
MEAMARLVIARVTAVLALTVALVAPVAVRAQAASPIAGAWSLNRSLSEMPPEIGFNVNWFPQTEAGGGSSNAGRGGGRGGGTSTRSGSTGPFSQHLESYDESRRVQLLTAEARNPPARVIIVDNPAAVTITNELGQSRVLHPNVKDDLINVEGLALVTNTRRDGDRLIVDYYVSKDRTVRYTYARSSGAAQLLVDVEFLERGTGEKARRVYEPGVATETSPAEPPRPPAAGAPPPRPAVPRPSDAAAPDSFDATPGAELRGLKTLGILVEDFSAQATGCGLNHDAVEAALSKRLSDGGFTVRRNSDEDTYVYVNVMTTTLSGTCVTRYDAFLYTHATANLSYRDRPVLVQVSLMHRGGMGSSAAMSHAAAVTRGLEDFVGLFVTQIRDANK